MMDENVSHQPSIEADCRIEAGDWLEYEVLDKVANQTFAAIVNHPRFRLERKVADGAEVSVLLTDDAHIQQINKQHRGKNTATNVLSFPQKTHTSIHYGPYLGDIVLGHETLVREASTEKKKFMHHYQHLLVHGFLHLVGYDHENDADGDAMESLETEILNRLGVDDPYRELIS